MKFQLSIDTSASLIIASKMCQGAFELSSFCYTLKYFQQLRQPELKSSCLESMQGQIPC